MKKYFIYCLMRVETDITALKERAALDLAKRARSHAWMCCLQTLVLMALMLAAAGLTPSTAVSAFLITSGLIGVERSVEAILCQWASQALREALDYFSTLTVMDKFVRGVEINLGIKPGGRYVNVSAYGAQILMSELALPQEDSRSK